MNDSLDVDPLEGSVGREEVAVVHAGRRSNDEVRLRNQGNGTDFSQRRIDLGDKLSNKNLVSSLQIDKQWFFLFLQAQKPGKWNGPQSTSN